MNTNEKMPKINLETMKLLSVVVNSPRLFITKEGRELLLSSNISVEK